MKGRRVFKFWAELVGKYWMALVGSSGTFPLVNGMSAAHGVIFKFADG